MSILNNIKNKYIAYKNHDSQAVKEINKGLEVLSIKDKSFNYKRWIMVFCILFFILHLLIGQSLYSKYNSAFIEIAQFISLPLLLIPVLMIIRLFRVIGKLESQVSNHKD